MPNAIVMLALHGPGRFDSCKVTWNIFPLLLSKISQETSEQLFFFFAISGLIAALNSDEKMRIPALFRLLPSIIAEAEIKESSNISERKKIVPHL